MPYDSDDHGPLSHPLGGSATQALSASSVTCGNAGLSSNKLVVPKVSSTTSGNLTLSTAHNDSGFITFNTQTSNSETERARLTNGGELCVNATAATATGAPPGVVKLFVNGDARVNGEVQGVQGTFQTALVTGDSYHNATRAVTLAVNATSLPGSEKLFVNGDAKVNGGLESTGSATFAGSVVARLGFKSNGTDGLKVTSLHNDGAITFETTASDVVTERARITNEGAFCLGSAVTPTIPGTQLGIFLDSDGYVRTQFGSGTARYLHTEKLIWEETAETILFERTGSLGNSSNKTPGILMHRAGKIIRQSCVIGKNTYAASRAASVGGATTSGVVATIRINVGGGMRTQVVKSGNAIAYYGDSMAVDTGGVFVSAPIRVVKSSNSQPSAWDFEEDDILNIYGDPEVPATSTTENGVSTNNRAHAVFVLEVAYKH